ncbi:hypothetical protein [Nocardia sp. NPDC050435]|uniref:hypothetical protein n=1 Tax=Nocardia sp. NPDC050435 TaxID=3155040 RepID=UPI0033E160EB
MKKPTRAQTRVLQGLHAYATELGQLTREAQQQRETTGSTPGREWFDRYHQYAILHEALTSAAHAAAVPPQWIGHARDAGERGIAWAEVEFAKPAAPKWDRVFSDLTAQARQLCEWTALDTARRQLGPVPAKTGEAFDRNLHALRSRLTGVVNLLDLNPGDGEQLWGTISDWVETGYQLLADHPAESIIQRWETAARVDTESLAWQATTLAQARIKILTSVALPDHDLLTARLGVLTLGQPSLFHHPRNGADISAAVEAAEADRTSAELVFSAADPPESVLVYEADTVAAPEFRAAAREVDL